MKQKLKCDCCGASKAKRMTKYNYGHRNGIYVGLYATRVVRCGACKNKL